MNCRATATVSSTRKILQRYALDHGYKNYRFYIDDGISGTTFNRPGFQQMIADIETGLVKRVIIKDMSRLGRDYLQVGMYTEIMFPEHDIHFIAVNDGVTAPRVIMSSLLFGTSSMSGMRRTPARRSVP